ncbi:MAG: glutamate--tRNA ligase [Pseudomonadota bacterium]
MTVITRFAPSPTGMLHIGNARTALINWLYARKMGGKFILRIDDTDIERSKKEYEDAIIRNLTWLGLDWDAKFSQSSRLDKYEAAKKLLIESGRLYECYETQSELEVKRKLQLVSGKPPLYDRAALALTNAQKTDYKAQGRQPHYRFLMKDTPIRWNDMIKGEMHYEAHHIGDPILIRENGSMTYMICSTVDDMEYNISHILRGEDHVTNTAIQIQLFEALGSTLPSFGHLSLVKTKEEKISKRKGGFEIDSLHSEEGLEAMAINSFFASIGTSLPVTAKKNLQELVQDFDITTFSKSPTTYTPEELDRINHKLILSLEYKDVVDRLRELGAEKIDEDFWLAVRPNLHKIHEAKDWWQICNHHAEEGHDLDKDYMKVAADLLPLGEFTENTWKDWTKKICDATGKSGKNLYHPLRIALTGMEAGPELKYLLPLIGREEALKRLK